MSDKTIETLLDELEGDPGRTMLEIGRCEEIKEQILTHCQRLTEERDKYREALKRALKLVDIIAGDDNWKAPADLLTYGQIFDEALKGGKA